MKKAIICAAGMGKRLGFDIPKSLVKVNNKYIIEYQLEALHNFDTTVVVGYKDDQVRKILEKYNCNIIFNKEYESTNTSYSISLTNFNENCLILDGDLLFLPEEINKLSFDEPWIGISKVKSSSPVFAHVIDNKVYEINYDVSEYEWACICYTNPIYFSGNVNNFVFETLNKHTPFLAKTINLYEIDTIKDLHGANIWMNSTIK